MPIGEVFLGAVVTVLFERLASKEVVNFARREGIGSQLKKWKDMLLKIQAVLADAEHKQIRATGEHNQLNLWLKDLTDLAYDIDDLLDEFTYDSLAKINRSAARGESSKAQRFGRCFRACNPCMVVSNARMESKIKGINDRFQYIAKQQESLRLSDTPSGSRPEWNLDDRITTCVVDKSNILGREKDRDAIIQLLQGHQFGVGVLPIIGMGGLGKTALAQLVYHDSTVKDTFSLRAWTCISVSDVFDIGRITRSILESLELTPKGTELNSLQVQLTDALSGKKFLIILDDVWNENYHSWDSLKVPFSSGLSGSMVIVTTRNERVASLVGDKFSPYCLMQLSDDICLSIFLQHALRATSFEAHQNLAGIGVEIANRCQGLPLAAKMLGGILRNQNKPEQWLAVLKSEIWDLPESGILPVLKLSYHHLPSHLKQCFAYCSLFPKDYEFEKQDMVLLWMAEGFLQPRPLDSNSFDDLMSRSFFQPSSNSPFTFVMHDLIHDLARHVASDAYFYVDNGNATSQDATIKVRHSSFVQGQYDTFKRLEVLGHMKSMRTFLPLSIEKRHWHSVESFLSRKVLLDLLPKLTRMRVLSLCYYRIKELPDVVGQLKHLRYLNMTGAEIEKLPESVTSLFSLLALILRRCENLGELPSSIGNLVNLQCLDLDDTPKLLRMPNGVKNLTGLQKLSKFIVGENEELGICDLKNFSSLRGELLITGLHNVADISSAIHANLNGKDGLEELCMKWSYEFDDSRDEEIEGQVLHHLQPPKSLYKLDIVCYGGKRLPCWIGDPLCAPNMVRLRIDGCKNLTALPPLGRLPFLEELTLCGLDGVTSVGDELYGYDDPLFVGKAFPSLETLSISHMLGWEEWSCSNGGGVDDLGRWELYSLHALTVINCPNLMGELPSYFPALIQLQIENCPQLTIPIATGSLSSLSYLNLDMCAIDQGSMQVHLSWLTELRLANISDLCSLNILNSLPCLHKLIIRKCPRLLSFGEISLPATLKTLGLIACEALKTLPPMHDECFLEDLAIYECSSLESFHVVKEAKNNEFVLWRARKLSTDNNNMLSGDIMVHGIEVMIIYKCPSLMCFPARGKKLCSSLKTLFIFDCENLHTLTEGMLMQDNNMPLSLEVIHIRSCPSLACFPTVFKLPTSLKKLTIEGLAAIPGTLPGSSLEQISISCCPSLEEFPESLVQNNIPSLKEFRVSDCESLRSLPNQMNSLTNLVDLSISNCPGLRWSNNPQEGGFGLPLNLEVLTIGRTLLHEKNISKWGLDCLTNLQYLFINGQGMDDVVFFPEYDDGKSFSLPTSLTHLAILDSNNLESLSNGLRKLIFLKELRIVRCPKLLSLPSEGLPSTLEMLQFTECPIVGERCKKDGGDYWPIIFHIPCVEIDRQVQ